MQVGASLEFRSKSETFESHFRYLTSDLLFMERNQRFSRARGFVDVIANAWLIGLADIPPGVVRIRSGENWIPLEGRRGLIVPPFSVLEWKVAPAEVRWFAYCSGETLFGVTPPFGLFSWEGSLPRSAEDLREMVLRSQIEPLIPQKRPSAVAARLKAALDLHYTEEAKIQRIGGALGYSRATLHREFSAAYGISPVSYRHRLRVFEATHLISNGSSITEACREVGYSDPGRFAQYFKRYLGMKPSEVSPRRTGAIRDLRDPPITV